MIHRTSKAYKPSTQGQVERTNRTLKGAMKLDGLLNPNSNPVEWLRDYERAYNLMCHRATGFAPLELHNGIRIDWLPNPSDTDFSHAYEVLKRRGLVEEFKRANPHIERLEEFIAQNAAAILIDDEMNRFCYNRMQWLAFKDGETTSYKEVQVVGDSKGVVMPPESIVEIISTPNRVGAYPMDKEEEELPLLEDPSEGEDERTVSAPVLGEEGPVPTPPPLLSREDADAMRDADMALIREEEEEEEDIPAPVTPAPPEHLPPPEEVPEITHAWTQNSIVHMVDGWNKEGTTINYESYSFEIDARREIARVLWKKRLGDFLPMYTKKSSLWLKVAMDERREVFTGTADMTTEVMGDKCKDGGLKLCVSVRKQDLELWEAAGIISIF